MEEAKGEPTPNQDFVVNEQRYIVPTKQGLIDQDLVDQYKAAHQQAMKDQNQGEATTEEKPPVPIVNAISSNQS